MVGFPEETEEEFEESLEFAKKIGFAKAHVFAYSRRKGTVADKMEGQIPNSVKHERSRKMISATCDSEEKFLKSLVGKNLSVLFESEEKGEWVGYTENYAKVVVMSDENLSGTLKNVKITSAMGEYCEGELL